MFHQKHTLRFFLIFLLLEFCISIDTITGDQVLRDGDVLISDKETFALGFFSPQNSSTSRYVGIWYNKISEHNAVWVANRNNPISNTSGVLSLDKNGNLVIFDTQKPDVLVWSSNVSDTAVAKNYSAQLLDSGNFAVFREDGASIVWQSFDFPTDTLLPDMKLGVDRKSGFTRFLTSWKSNEDPGTGVYSFGFDIGGSVAQVYMNKSSDPYWRGGPWNGVRWSGLPEMSQSSIFNEFYVENQEEASFRYTSRDASIFSRIVLNGSAGIVNFLNWQEDEHKWVEFWSVPNDKCDSFAFCGPFGDCGPYNAGLFPCKCLPGFEPKLVSQWNLRDGSGGCVRKLGVSVCGNGEGFVKVAGVKVPDTSNARVDRNLEMKACEELCLRNCSCTGYMSADINGGNGCLTWYGELVDIREYSDGDQDLYIRVDAQELVQYSKKPKGSHSHGKVIILVTSIFAALLVLLIAYWFHKKKKKRRDERRSHELSVHFSRNEEEDISERGTSTDVHYYSLSTIIEATENFSLPNKVGEGGFGSVYKGILENGQEIAVKRLSRRSGQGREEFRNEVTLIAKLQHRNLVKLLGFCTQKEEKMLIYEYLPNKGLDDFIFDEGKKSKLDWKLRFNIILGVARGMVYLHHDSRLRIIHRDLKASNVLLDAFMNPKISDFGMARIFGGDQNEEITRRVVGTYGYMSPEYAMEGLYSVKSDVFSFGVLILEIISGRKNNNIYYRENSVNLIGHVWDLWREGKALDIVDSVLGHSHEQDEEILRCIHIGLVCVEESASARPTMSEVVFMLSNGTTLPHLSHPAFIIRTPNEGIAYGSSTSTQTGSVNEVTITNVQGR